MIIKEPLETHKYFVETPLLFKPRGALDQRFAETAVCSLHFLFHAISK